MRWLYDIIQKNTQKLNNFDSSKISFWGHFGNFSLNEDIKLFVHFRPFENQNTIKSS